MPRRKRTQQAIEMNRKRWRKESSDCNITESSVVSGAQWSNKRLDKLGIVEKSEKSATDEYILVNFNQINKLITCAKCCDCENQTLKLELGTQLGFSYNLKLTCSYCEESKTVINTSLKTGIASHDVNLRMTQAFSHIGKGYTGIEKFCMVMNIPPFSSTTYGKCARHLDGAYSLASESIFTEIYSEIKQAYQSGVSSSAEILDISVSFDGTWLTRGHTSLIGVGCVIDILTGYVIDFEVMSKVCRHCSVAKKKLGESSAEFQVWYEGHKNVCDINHSGSSASMEMQAALRLWKRSISLGFRYATVLSDGDCKTFNYLCEREVYGPDFTIKKEECINHVSKRLGTALRSCVKDCRAQGITLGGKAHGSLKEATIQKLTTYYQKAILRNKGDANAMKTAIYATLYHSISTDAKPQHSKCPAGINSWCFYQSAVAKGDKPGKHKLNVGTPINEKFLPKILPIYQRLASNELLERCIRCGTQNANESLHSTIWAKCPKEIFVNKQRVKRAVIEAVCEFNKGAVRTIAETQKALGLCMGNSTKRLAATLDCRKRLFRKRRQNSSNKLALKLIKRAIYKREQLAKRREGITYGAGCF